MIVNLIKVGNSKGFRIPANILSQMKSDAFELLFNEKRKEIVIKPVSNPRQGWAEACRQMHENGDDAQIIDDSVDINFGLED